MSKNEIKYITGDATDPKSRTPMVGAILGKHKQIIMHICNDIGVWGAGFVMALSKKWSEPEADYLHKSINELTLGDVYFVDVGDGIIVANMIAQRGTAYSNGRPPIRYGALELCLEKVADYVNVHTDTVHAPRIGADRAGGDWTKIESLINQELVNRGVNVTIYDLPVSPPKQVIVMRKKFPDGHGDMRKLRTGKMVSQGAHASMASILNQMDNYTIDDNSGIFGIQVCDMSKSMKDWIEGRFTKVCVSVDTEEELIEIHERAKDAGFPCALITDSGLTEFGGVPTHTCVGIGPAPSSEIDKITGRLPLM